MTASLGTVARNVRACKRLFCANMRRRFRVIRRVRYGGHCGAVTSGVAAFKIVQSVIKCLISSCGRFVKHRYVYEKG